MKFVIQRVTEASVEVEHKIVGKIGKGYLVFVGVGQGDTEEIADRYLKKLLGLRIFEDENGKTNLSLKDVDGELLLVSQFTLYASCKKAIAQVSQTPVIRNLHSGCMNISFRKRKNRCLWWKPAFSAPR